MQPKKEDDEIIILHKDLMTGLYLTRTNAENFLKYSQQMHKEANFQTAIPLATISIEESKKGVELIGFFVDGKNITKQEWNKLTNHKYKLTHDLDMGRKIISNFSTEQFNKVYDKLEQQGITSRKFTKEELIKKRDLDREVILNLQTLREICFYGDWNKTRKIWKSFYDLSENEQEALSSYVSIIAETHLWLLHDFNETLENDLKKQPLLYEIVYPYCRYPEIRNPLQYESKKESDELELKKTQNKEKISFGVSIFRKFILN